MMTCVSGLDGLEIDGDAGATNLVSGAPLVITIDGPAASGKSSVSRLVAQELGIPYVSSGLLYRAATYLAQAQGQPLDDEGALLRLLAARQVNLVTAVGARNRVAVSGSILDSELHTDTVDAGVSEVARHPGVRKWVDARLRELGGAFIVEGRDMGTEVFPNAALKVYLSAPPEVRAARRVEERRGDLEQITRALRRRDLLDAAQSRPAEDALHLDTRQLNLGEVVARVLEAAAEVTNAPRGAAQPSPREG